MQEELERLIKRYKIELEQLKANKNFSEASKIATACIFREVINDLEQILLNKK